MSTVFVGTYKQVTISVIEFPFYVTKYFGIAHSSPHFRGKILEPTSLHDIQTFSSKIAKKNVSLT